MGILQETLLSLFEAPLHGEDRVLRELRVAYNKLMELVSEEVSALCAPVAVVDREERAPGPVVNLFEFRLDDVQDYRDSILVVIPYHSLMGVGCIGHDDPVLLGCELGRVVVLPELLDLVFFHVLVLLPLSGSHLHATVSYDAVSADLFYLFLLLHRGGELVNRVFGRKHPGHWTRLYPFLNELRLLLSRVDWFYECCLHLANFGGKLVCRKALKR